MALLDAATAATYSGAVAINVGDDEVDNVVVLVMMHDCDDYYDDDDDDDDCVDGDDDNKAYADENDGDDDCDDDCDDHDEIDPRVDVLNAVLRLMLTHAPRRRMDDYVLFFSRTSILHARGSCAALESLTPPNDFGTVTIVEDDARCWAG